MPNRQSLPYGMKYGSGGIGLNSIKETISYSDFTDGGSTAGTYSMTTTIPAGSWVIGTKVDVNTGFTGDTSCVLDIGDGTDADAFTYTTHNIYTATTNLMEAADGVGGGATGHGLYNATSAVTVTLTATSATDWGLVTAGEIEVAVYYLETANLT